MVAPDRKPASKTLIPWLVAIAFLMQSLDTTVLNTAVPAIAKSLNVSQLEMKSVLASYALSLAVFIPASGWVADRFGTRNVFAAAIGIFTLGSVLCGLSSTVTELMLFRILQGMGGAMMVPVGRLIMVRSFEKTELTSAMSFVTVPSLIGPLVGPTLGGFIVSVTSWDYIFWLNVPIGIIGLVLVYLLLPDYREKDVPPLDILGLVYFGSGIALLSWVLEVFGSHSTSSALILAASLTSAALLLMYWRHARRMLYPLLDIGLMKIRSFAVSVAGGFVTRLGVGGAPFLLPLLYQTGLGFTPVQSGLLMVPQALGALASKIFVNSELALLGYRPVLIGNTVLLGVMLILFGTIGIQTPIWLICVQAAIYGILMSTQFTAMNTLTYADVPTRQASNASAFAGTFQQLSMSFGIAAAGLVSATFVGTTSDAAAMITGVHHGFWVLGAITIASAAVFMLLHRDDGASLTGKTAALPAVTDHNSGVAVPPT